MWSTYTLGREGAALKAHRLPESRPPMRKLRATVGLVLGSTGAAHTQCSLSVASTRTRALHLLVGGKP